MGADSSPTTSLLAEQRGRWKKGDRVRVEQFLAKQPDLREQTEVLLDLIYGEVVLRREAGEKPGVREYVERFPTLAEPIRLQFEVDDAIGPTRVGDESHATDPIVEDANPPPPAPPGYEIIREIGRGGMGIVYLARQRALDRLVALKMIRSGELADPDDRKRFAGEARAAARLSHPNVVQVYEVGDSVGRPFLAMEYVPGGTLADALRAAPLAFKSAASLAIKIARAIQHAHDNGIVHRDLKPANILLGTELRPTDGDKTWADWTLVMAHKSLKPRVADFGLAKRIGADGPTITGAFIGTPNFAAPEQAAGRDVGPAADIWALGGILYMMLTGRPPFAGSSPVETLDQVRFNDPVPPSNLRPNLPRDLETIALACLRKDPAKRYQSAAALADDLERFQNGEAIRARPVGSIEKAVKWCRRRPALAGTIGAFVLLAAFTFVTVTFLWQRAATARDSERSALQVEASARINERTERERAESRTAELLVSNARNAWMTDDLPAARALLAECPPERRTPEWTEMNRLCSASRLVWKGADFPTDVIAFSPDGRRLLSGTAASRVYVWDSATGRLLKEVNVAMRMVHSAAFTPEGNVAVAVQRTILETDKQRRDVGEVVILNPETNRVVNRWERPDRPVRFEISADGRRVLCISTGAREAIVCDVATGNFVYRCENKTGMMTRGSFSADGRFLATGGLPHDVCVWHAETGALVKRFKPGDNFFGFQAVASSADGKRVAISRTNAGTSGASGDLLILPPTGEPMRLTNRLSQVSATAFDPSDKWCAAFSVSETAVNVWSAATGQPQITLRGFRSEVRSMAFHPDGKHIAVGYKDGRIIVWDVDP